MTSAYLSPSTLSTRGQPTVTDTVEEGLRSMLITGALAPGSRIDQVELARRFNVSIVPIREAMVRLASVGLIEIASRRGFFVAPISADELVDLYTVREVLEEQATRIAVDRLTDADVDDLENIADAMGVAAKRKDLDRYLILNREFHFTLYRATKRRHMMQTIERMWDLSARYSHLLVHAVPDRVSQALMEIRAIIAACRRRDREEAGVMVRYKLHQTSVSLLERMHLPAEAARRKTGSSKPRARRGRRGSTTAS